MLLVNLAFVSQRPTGLTVYAQNLSPHLKPLAPVFASAYPISWGDRFPISPHLSSDSGSGGHLRRLVWTQRQLPQLCRKLGASLLFSPVPEAPLGTSCRYIVTVHDLIALRFPKLAPLTFYARYYIPPVLAGAEHIICNSQATARDIIDLYGIEAAKITPIPLAYDRAHFQPDSSPSSNIPYFLFLGRHDPYKNLQRAIAALASLPSEYQLWCAGSPDRRYTPKLQRLIAERELGERVRFLDYVPYQDLPSLLKGAIALVYPSLWEGFGLPVLEAMACGTPTITSNCSALPEVAGDAAVLVDPYNVSEIAAAMKAIANQSQLRATLRHLGIQRSQQFSWSKTGAATVELLECHL